MTRGERQGTASPVTTRRYRTRPARHLFAAGAGVVACLAAAPQAAAAETVEAPSCSAVVDGIPGQEVVLDPSAVVEPVTGALAGLDPLGLLTGPLRQAWQNSGPIHLGTLSVGQHEIPGNRIADAVIARLGEIPVAGPVLEQLTPAVTGALDSLCGILVRVTTPAGPDRPPPPEEPGGPSPVPGGAPDPGAAEPDGPARGAVFGERIPGLSLSGAALDLSTVSVPQPGSPVAAGEPALAGASRAAGSASALPADRDTLSQPVLLAVLALTIVSAQLVRRLASRPRRR
ncbi:hypothetical protein OG943_21350 [Amycolatopsis sp. NBC_00345]|uniref:hypothetical protein n=1 Tax=Amycolatopsis sp. NBC_00345 TaxID=2975955 RepID=UPI002E252DE3